MHHTISYRLARAYIADLRHQAQRDAPARAAAARGPWVLHRTCAIPGTAQATQPAVAVNVSVR